jgi:uroporphyrinogen decarboxylase
LALHCCGNITPILDDIVELGVDVINPVQLAAKNMDSAFLKGKYGDKLSFWGGIDTQHVLPYGSPENVTNEVRRRIEDLATGGGYLLAASHTIQPDVSPENICAMFDTERSLR